MNYVILTCSNYLEIALDLVKGPSQSVPVKFKILELLHSSERNFILQGTEFKNSFLYNQNCPELFPLDLGQ